MGDYCFKTLVKALEVMNSNQIKVVQVVGNIQELGSGPAHSVPALCQSLWQQGAKVELHVNLGNKPVGADYDFFAHGRSRLLKRLWWSTAMYRTLKYHVSESDIIHTHGCWVMPYIYPAWVSRGTKCKLIISPRGNLGIFPLNQSKWKKKLMWFLWQKNAFMDATCIHATSDNEYLEIRAAGIAKKPVAIIHNGVHLPLLQPNGYQCNRRDEDGLSSLLYFGRMAPIKGIDILLAAWSAIYKLFPTWNLVIAGTDERGYRKKMEDLAKELQLQRVQFTGPAYGDDKFRIYRNAQLFVLPTHNENFGMTVAEALAHELPVIVTKGAPWSGVESHGCGWWIDTGADPLTEALKKALSETPDQLRVRGRKGREWMKKDFSWESIGQKMFMTYKWLLEGGERPPWVRFN